jgi:hypothetical protein
MMGAGVRLRRGGCLGSGPTNLDLGLSFAPGRPGQWVSSPELPLHSLPESRRHEFRPRAHRRLVEAAGVAEQVASEVSLPPGIDFKTARGRVRQALHAHGVGGESSTRWWPKSWTPLVAMASLERPKAILEPTRGSHPGCRGLLVVSATVAMSAARPEGSTIGDRSIRSSHGSRGRYEEAKEWRLDWW